MATKTATTATATATATAKKGQSAKAPAPVVQQRTYPKLPKGFVCHGTAGLTAPVTANVAMYATPRKLGVLPSVGIPSGHQVVTLCAAQPNMGTKYQSAYAAVAAGFAAATKAHGNTVTAAQVQALVPAWPAAKPKANSAWRHVVRTLGVAWQPAQA